MAVEKIRPQTANREARDERFMAIVVDCGVMTTPDMNADRSSRPSVTIDANRLGARPCMSASTELFPPVPWDSTLGIRPWGVFPHSRLYLIRLSLHPPI